jgi:hypothetical protein
LTFYLIHDNIRVMEHFERFYQLAVQMSKHPEEYETCTAAQRVLFGQADGSFCKHCPYRCGGKPESPVVLSTRWLKKILIEEILK